MDPKKKRLIAGGAVGLLLVGMVLVLFRNSLFGGSAQADASTPEVQAAVQDAQQRAEPPPPEPLKSNFTKKARQVGGH